MSLVAEYAVQMKCHSCVEKIKASLKDVEGITGVEVSYDKGTVLVESSLPSSVIQQILESNGNTAVLKGYGGKLVKSRDRGDNVTTAAVAMLGYPIGYSKNLIKGVVRFVQADDDVCVIDGTIDGLTTGYHGLHIHECGDISQGCDSVGDHFDLSGGCHGGPQDEPGKRHTGDLGNIEADETGRAVFRLEDGQVKVWDIIGRSIVVTSNEDDYGRGFSKLSSINGSSGERLACGIISRSAGLFENAKQICACDGVTIWDERNRPLAGPGRRQPPQSSL
ncbi:unnamed protein product [Nezara viridula]|uniref:Extracellular superoxide dismutase [Cu-Zn] n=1 Tax=Nezara viridula TaxID=85310 RepID=A0A9P0MP29_NEZVI|nr:unnamed protein product [Nezara viridula]